MFNNASLEKVIERYLAFCKTRKNNTALLQYKTTHNGTKRNPLKIIYRQFQKNTNPKA